MANHYSVLGISRRAGHDEIRRAYLAEARRWHPDRFNGADESESSKAEATMRRINEAWRVLGDEAKRSDYDLSLSGNATDSLGATGVQFADGITRVDPRLLDPQFLHERRMAQEFEISDRSAFLLKAIPWGGFLALLVGVFVFTAYARSTDQPEPITVPGPGLGVEAGACVRVMQGPALLAVPCTGITDGMVIGARFADGVCPTGTDNEVQLGEDKFACLMRQ